MQILHERFGEADVILSIRISRVNGNLILSQSQYIQKVLKKFNVSDCSVVSTLRDPSEIMLPNDGNVVSQLEYVLVIDVSCML